jgi:hypothetical protein
MRVKVITEGHQVYYENEGEVIQWCSAVERYDDRTLQVPAVLINTGSEITLVPLQKRLHWTRIEVLADPTTHE